MVRERERVVVAAYLRCGGLLVRFCECSAEDSGAGEYDLGYYAMRLAFVLAWGLSPHHQLWREIAIPSCAPKER